MIDNKFKLGQRVRVMGANLSFIIEEIFSGTGDRYEGKILYTSHTSNVRYLESELELVKEKKKVTLFAPIYRNNGCITMFSYSSDKSTYSDSEAARIIGWHELVVEVDDE